MCGHKELILKQANSLRLHPVNVLDIKLSNFCKVGVPVASLLPVLGGKDDAGQEQGAPVWDPDLHRSLGHKFLQVHQSNEDSLQVQVHAPEYNRHEFVDFILAEGIFFRRFRLRFSVEHKRGGNARNSAHDVYGLLSLTSALEVFH